jgi:hypothetical protein
MSSGTITASKVRGESFHEFERRTHLEEQATKKNAKRLKAIPDELDAERKLRDAQRIVVACHAAEHNTLKKCVKDGFKVLKPALEAAEMTLAAAVVKNNKLRTSVSLLEDELETLVNSRHAS